MDQISPTNPAEVRPADQMPQEKVDLLVELFQKGYSYGHIAKEIGKTRNAVAGQVFKLRKRGVILENRPPAIIRVKKAKERAAPKTRVRLTPTTVPEQPEPKRVRLQLIESPTAVTFGELAPHHCKFPIGDPRRSDFRFCGGQRLANKPYCAEHVKLTEQPTLVRLRASRY